MDETKVESLLLALKHYDESGSIGLVPRLSVMIQIPLNGVDDLE